MRPQKIQISLRIRAICSESSLGEFWIANDAKFLHAANEDSGQTAQADLRLRWEHIMKGTFSHLEVHMLTA